MATAEIARDNGISVPEHACEALMEGVAVFIDRLDRLSPTEEGVLEREEIARKAQAFVGACARGCSWHCNFADVIREDPVEA